MEAHLGECCLTLPPGPRAWVSHCCTRPIWSHLQALSSACCCSLLAPHPCTCHLPFTYPKPSAPQPFPSFPLLPLARVDVSDCSPQLELLAFFCIDSHFVISCPLFSKLPRSLLVYFPILSGAVRSTAQFVIICRFN